MQKHCKSNKGLPLSPSHCEALTIAQGKRKLNANNKTGYKNLSYAANGKDYLVHVAGVYVGTFNRIEFAISARDKRRNQLGMELPDD